MMTLAEFATNSDMVPDFMKWGAYLYGEVGYTEALVETTDGRYAFFTDIGSHFAIGRKPEFVGTLLECYDYAVCADSQCHI